MTVRRKLIAKGYGYRLVRYTPSCPMKFWRWVITQEHMTVVATADDSYYICVRSKPARTLEVWLNTAYAAFNAAQDHYWPYIAECHLEDAFRYRNFVAIGKLKFKASSQSARRNRN